jgi:hypothetical protein
VDVTTGAESNELTVSLNDDQVGGCTGMALDPISGDVFVLAKVGSSIILATIDLSTGDLTQRASFTEKFAGIAFDDAGVLYGITGDGSNTPETLYSINPNTGAITMTAQPGIGSDGEAIAFNPSNGLLYRYGGSNVFQSIDPGTGTVTDIFTTGATLQNAAHALVYNNGSFVLSAGTQIFQLSVNGTLALLTDLPGFHVGYKGLLNVTAVGIQERESAEAPTLFPNPASSTIFLQVSTGRIDRVRVHDARGSLVIDTRVESTTQHALSVDQLPAGLYTVELFDEALMRTGTFSVAH